MSYKHMQKGAQQSRVWDEFYSLNFDPNWQKSKKTRGVGWENEHKKLSCEPNPLHLAYNIPLRLLYRSPPLTTLTSHYVHRNSDAHLTKTTTTASKEGNDQMEEDRSFFCLKLTVFEIFLAITELMSYNIFLFYSYRFFFGCLSVFLIHRHFPFVVCRFFFGSWFFLDTVIYFFFFYAAFYLLHKFLSKFCPWFNIEHL